MRVAWWSNAPWASTGYGTQTRQVVSRMKAEGHDVAVLANYGVNGFPLVWDGIQVYPAGMGAHSMDTVVRSWQDWASRSAEPCLLVTLYDVWPLFEAKVDTSGVPVVASWVPVDCDPVPEKVAGWCERLEVTPIAMAKFGQAKLAERGIDALYVPHAIDTSVFTPDADGAAWRSAYGIPEDAFVVCINAANKSNGYFHRKAFPEMFDALGRIMAKHSDVWLFLHTHLLSGFDLAKLAAAAAIPLDRVRHVDQHRYVNGLVLEPEMAQMYCASDVLLSTSYGEGFGIAVIEAQACGTPVIVSDATAQPELLGDGWLVPAQRWWVNGMGAWMYVPSVGHIVQALEQAHSRGRGRSAKAAEFAQAYDADHVYRTHWKPTLDQLEGRLHDLEALVP